jgi:hypothetical protein
MDGNWIIKLVTRIVWPRYHCRLHLLVRVYVPLHTLTGLVHLGRICLATTV